ncbi:hypothetical protein Aab01nite_13000 [Paractinoplanes abujensis]|uniref:Uncharacterized protein n=1 Tax=Paractinoplanes abujensis TaxID=882441 RepID=A0A7W7FYC3_9ACTN|nr:hypothetical protein [Actinoplanes abujensis]MBB4690878.1 hypothetical protein [Actinoplanes abujensis]GID17710.1 hypothetical protein Aab01nite_13000 [Actinoplanes abujensis]
MGEGIDPVVNAVIYVRPENYSASAARCLDYCSNHRYNVVGIIPGDWPAAMRMLELGSASVVVVSSVEQIEPRPGVEIAPKPSSRRKAGARSAANSARNRWTDTTPQTSTEPAAARHYRY